MTRRIHPALAVILIVAVLSSIRIQTSMTQQTRTNSDAVLSVAAVDLEHLLLHLENKRDTSPLQSQNETISIIEKQETEPVDEDSVTAVSPTFTPFNSNNSFSDDVFRCLNMEGENITLPLHFPRFIIFGAQKGGTTALSEILKHHPNVMSTPAGKREPHFFDFHVTKRNEMFEDPAFVCHTRRRYIEENFNVEQYRRRSQKGPIFAFEKTPSYIRYVGTAYRTHAVLGKDIKLIAVLRNPIERSYSSYKMEILRHSRLADTFDVLIETEIEALRNVGLTRAPPVPYYTAHQEASLDNGTYSFEPVNLTFAQRRHIVHYSKTPLKGKMKKMKDNSLYTGMYASQLTEWLEYYELDKHILVLRSEDMNRNLDKTLQRVQEFLGLPVIEFPPSILQQDYNPLRQIRGVDSSGLRVDRPSKHTEAYLKRFFQPYNVELADVLGDDWRGAWE